MSTSTRTIAAIDYITDGTPLKTVVVATLSDGTQVNLTNTVTSIKQEAGDPRIFVTIVGQAPIRDRNVGVSV